MSASEDRTASLMTPAKLAQVGAAKAKVSPAAYLDQMAADVGHQHVSRLAELRADLEMQAGASRAATVLPALHAFSQALPALDFGLLQSRGFWAGVTGKSRTAGAEFAAQAERLEAAARELAGVVPAVQKDQQQHAASTDRTLVEVEVEYRALDRVIDQGARWLQDMRNQLKAREAQAGADLVEQAQLREDAARCEVLVMRLKSLRAAASAAQQAHQQAVATAQRRAGLMQALQKLLSAEVKPWQAALSRLASAAAEGKSGLATEGAQELHAELRQHVDRLLADFGQLRTDEGELVRLLAEMGRHVVPA